MKRILIIRFSALGDVAMIIPIVRAVAQQYPENEYTVLSRANYASLFANLPANIHFVGADLKGRHKGIAGLNILLKEIDYTQFDAVADLHHVLRSRYIALCCLLKDKRVAHICKGRWAKWWLTHHGTRPIQPLESTIARYTRVFQRLGLPITLPTFQTLQIENRTGIGIAPFAAHKGKIYPLEKMEKVVQLLSEQTAETIYLFGAGPKEKAILDDWATKYAHVESLVGKHTMQEELGIMASLRVMLTMDSANMHLASLVHTPVISIWGATHPYAGFLGIGQRMEDCVQLPLACRPCSIYGNKPCKYGTYACLHDITPEMILAKAQSYLS